MSKFVCNHCFIDYGDKQSFIEHTHKVVERKEKRAVKSTTKSQTDNTEWLDSILEILHNSWLEDDYEYDDPDGLHAKEQILAKLKQQDIKSRIDELGNVQLDYGRQTARVWVDGKIIGILERLDQLRSLL